MTFRIVCIGKTKQGFIEEGIEEYRKRIESYYPLKLETLPDVKLTDTINPELVKEKEGELLEKKMQSGGFNIVLDERGKQFSSLAFSGLINDRLGKGEIIFIIGGVYGLSEKIRNKADLLLGLSDFTFTHQMIRMILLEQIYRAVTIIKKKKYHY